MGRCDLNREKVVEMIQDVGIRQVERKINEHEKKTEMQKVKRKNLEDKEEQL